MCRVYHHIHTEQSKTHHVNSFFKVNRDIKHINIPIVFVGPFISGLKMTETNNAVIIV